MKIIALLFSVYLVSPAFCDFTSKLWEFSVVVLDESDQPMANVQYSIMNYSKKGSRWVRDREVGFTKSKGEFVFKKTTIDVLGVGLFHDGYFNATISPEARWEGVPEGRWLPAETVYTVKMVKREELRPLFVKLMHSTDKPALLEANDKALGYDLMVGDWVAPFGKGEIGDLFFKAKTMKLDEEGRGVGVEYEVFTNGKFNGLIQVKDNHADVPYRIGSLKLGQTAPKDGYKQKLEFVNAFGPGSEKFHDDPKDTAWDGQTLRDQADGYWLRIRSEVDPETGELISAHYGKIVSPLILYSTRDGRVAVSFDYMVSPDPNNRSVVWDRETTLIPGYKMPSWGARYY